MADSSYRWRPRRGRSARATAALLAVLALGVAGGCGVTSSGSPVDLGDALSVGGGFDKEVRLPDGPSLGTSAERLVALYLLAASGGDNMATSRMRAFLSKNALAAWREPAPATVQSQALPLTIIRVVSGPTKGADVNDRTPITITYQVVGRLTDQGLADPEESSGNKSMTFWVTAERETSLRIDEITGDVQPGLVASDDALTTFYRPQPIYFWDSTNTHLIPDLRYVPLTLGPDQRAQKVVQWVLDTPSPWLAGIQFAQRLPIGTGIKDGVTKSQSGAWLINLTAPNGIGDEGAVRRLLYQLQWSLRLASTASIDLAIDGQLQRPAVGADDFLTFNLSYELGQVRQTSYDIVDQRVVAVPANSANLPAVLKSQSNQNVAYAAVDRSGTAMALVRVDSAGKRYLQIARDPGGAAVDTKVPRRADMRRPVWIPGTSLVLVPSGGSLWLVQPNGDATEIRKAGITSVSVAPDGRRIAWVAGGQAYVAPLMADGSAVYIGGRPRPVLAGQLKAEAITWTGEAWLAVAGTTPGGEGAMWRTTVDSAVAQAADLKGTVPKDVVALATGSPLSAGQVLLFTEQGRYTFGSLLSGENSLKNPFYVS